MKTITVATTCLLAAFAASCYRPAGPAPGVQPRDASIDYWLDGMKGVKPGDLSETQQKQKERFLNLAWRQLVAAGEPAAQRIRQELEAYPDDAYFQLSVSMVLYQIDGAEAHSDVVKVLNRTSIEDNAFQYFYLCHRLARGRDEAVLPVLEKFLANKKIVVFIDKDSPMLDPQTACIYLYGVFGPGAIPALKKACTHEDATVRANAAAVLGYFGDDDPLLVLADLLIEDADERVRATAANALGQLDHLAAISPVAGALTKDENPSVRAACAFALGEVQHDTCVDGLAIALNDLSPQVRQYAASSLECVGTENCSDVVANRLVIEKNTNVRQALIKALGFLGYGKWLPLLKKIADGEGDDAAAAAEAIRSIKAFGPPGREPYPDLDGSKVSPARLEEIIQELCEKHGEEIDQFKKTVFLSSGKDDLPKLEELRCRVLWVVNSDTVSRLSEVSKLIRLVKRKTRDML